MKNTTKFNQKIAMKVSKEQWELDLKDPLVALGYHHFIMTFTSGEKSYLTTKMSSHGDTLTTINNELCLIKDSVNIIPGYNPDLFLALAAMTDIKEGCKGEWWVYVGTKSSNSFTKGKLYYQQNYKVNTPRCFIDNMGNWNGYYKIGDAMNLGKFRKATVNELMAKFNYLQYKDGDLITLGGIGYKVIGVLSVFILSNRDGVYNGEVFNKFSIDKLELQKETLGYTSTGDFPECKTLEDLNKFIEAILSKIENMTEENMKWKMKPEFEKFRSQAETIAGYIRGGTVSLEEYLSKDHPTFTKNLREAGVLDLWFEQVEKIDSVEVVMNQHFSVVVKGEQAYHKSENITGFVRELVATYKKFGEFGGYAAEIKGDIIFSRTGCQHNETKLSDWVEVYDLITTQ